MRIVSRSKNGSGKGLTRNTRTSRKVAAFASGWDLEMGMQILGGSADENWGYRRTPKVTVCKLGRIAPGSMDDWPMMHICCHHEDEQGGKGGMVKGGGEGNGWNRRLFHQPING